ncbi:MAG: AAA family ATPase [Lachnospiraceae bacterium]|nr:AAA family ATPase [Candidatus Merdinaster equi]
MVQKNLKELIETVDTICKMMSDAGVVKETPGGMSIKETFHFELLKFAVYLADADMMIDLRELALIDKYLGIKADAKNLKAMKYRENVDDQFGLIVPSSIKYAVLADAGHKVTPDIYKSQKAMIVYDTFKLFGETILALHVEDANKETLSRFTSYTERIEKFLKDYGVFYVGSQKMIQPIAEGEEVKSADESLNDVKAKKDEKAKGLDELLDEFNSLIGLSEVKHQVNSLINLIKVQKMREANGMKSSDVSKHMVFSGNPGTGKTTVARMLGEIYKAIGVLPKGQLVEVDRGGLVKGFVGQTATKTLEVIEEAMGGILFIDEAYTLTVGKGENDFGQEAVDTLLKAMEDHRSEFVVIVAGYTELMEQFLCSNPGLKSRFSNYIDFPDYSADELMEILKMNCKKQEYKLSENALCRAKELIDKRVANKPDNFANARDVRNFMEHAISNHATRIVGMNLDKSQVSKELLSTLEAEDLQDFE